MDIEMYENLVTLLPLAKNGLNSTLNAEKSGNKGLLLFCYLVTT